MLVLDRVDTDISVLKAEHARAVLSASSYREKIGLIAVHMDQFLGKKALVTLQHEEWRIHRKLISSAFKYAHLKSMVKDVSDVGKNLVNTLRSGTHGDNGRLNVVDVMKKATLDVIGRVSFNHRFECLSSSSPPEMAKAFKFYSLKTAVFEHLCTQHHGVTRCLRKRTENSSRAKPPFTIASRPY